VTFVLIVPSAGILLACAAYGSLRLVVYCVADVSNKKLILKKANDRREGRKKNLKE
jgi:hypothetical protein